MREPLQVYLDRGERARLDAIARALGVSRAEVLRRGIEAVAREHAGTVYDKLAPLIGAFDAPRAPRDLAERLDDYVTRDQVSWRPRRRSS